jgi:hypothetical protein
MQEDRGGAAQVEERESTIAQKLSRLGRLMRQQEHAEAELGPSFAAELRARLVQVDRDFFGKRAWRRHQAGQLALAVALLATGVLIDRLHRRHASPGTFNAPLR